MDELIKVLPNYKKYNSYINDVKNKISPIMLSGLTDARKGSLCVFYFILCRKANLHSNL